MFFKSKINLFVLTPPSVNNLLESRLLWFLFGKISDEERKQNSSLGVREGVKRSIHVINRPKKAIAFVLLAVLLFEMF